MKIGFYGDPHSSYPGSAEVHTEILARLKAAGCSVVLNLGDSVYNRTKPIELAWAAHAAEVTIGDPMKMFAVRGNHDDEANYSIHYPIGSSFVLPLRTIVIIALEAYASGEQPPCTTDYSALAFQLDQWLFGVQHIPFKVVCCHVSPYSTGTRGSNVCVRNALRPVLEAHRVDIHLSGHNHVYEHFLLNGVRYLVSGAAGGVPHELDTAPDTPELLPFRVACHTGYNFGIMETEALGNGICLTVKIFTRTGEEIDCFDIWKSGNLEIFNTKIRTEE